MRIVRQKIREMADVAVVDPTGKLKNWLTAGFALITQLWLYD